jgi:hypothetical protein
MTAEPAPRPLRLVESVEVIRLKAVIESMQLDLENAQTEIRSLRRRLSAMKNEQARATKADPNYAMAERLFEYWKQECCHPHSQLGEKREAALLAMLAKYTPHQIGMAIKGAAVGAYVDEKGKRHDELELICRNEVKLESFIDRYQRWRGRHG